MKNNILTIVFSVIISVSAIALFIFYGASAKYNYPSASAPNCPDDNPACSNPINVDIYGQIKSGGLLLGSGLGSGDIGLIVLNGYVGIGTASPNAKLDVNGDVKVLGTNNYSYKLNIMPNISYGDWQNGWSCCGGWPNNSDLGVNGGVDTCDGNVKTQYSCSGAPKKCNDTWDYWNGSCNSCGNGPNGKFRTVDCGTTASINGQY